MKLNKEREHSRAGAAAMALTLVAASLTLGAQTNVSLPENRYTIAQDVQVGREAAQAVEDEMPLFRDNATNALVEGIGQQLADSIPEEFRHEQFDYTFKVVNVSDANAFALPGGPIYINRGMIEIAANESELAGVLAHELSHVALRHGTAQATKAMPYQIGSIAGAVLGAIIGGRTGEIVSQGTQFGLGTAFLRYGRQFERDADLLGAQIMARAGYDPRYMADMFGTLEKMNRSGAPEFLSSHPNPGNRQEAIEREAELLEVGNTEADSEEFRAVSRRLSQMDPAPTMAEVSATKDR